MNDPLIRSFLGSLIADAVAMPVHWYYDREQLDRDYGVFDGYVDPHNPHSGSILWRSQYEPRNEKGDIIHDQAQYWGQRGIHYHQFLKAGENTVNYKLALELYRQVVEQGSYDPDAWLERYIEKMRTPGWHGDTYVEEYHRAFFDHLAQGQAPRKCGIVDIHIGGIAQVPALVAALGSGGKEVDVAAVRGHVALTHRAPEVDQAATALTRILVSMQKGTGVRESILEHASGWIGQRKLEKLERLDDRTVIGKHYTPACYLPDSFTASLYLAWKYASDFSEGILANARCGGDNCHRGAVVGSILGAGNEIPQRWIDGLLAAPGLLEGE